MQTQQTIGQSVSMSGVGLHSACPSQVTLSPAPPDNGIVFRRKVNSHVETCQALIRNLRPVELCTAIGSNGFQIQTTEHVLSALWGLGIDNAFIDIDSEEVPAMDGSAAPFAQLIQLAGGRAPGASSDLSENRGTHPHQKPEPRNFHSARSPSKITYTIDYNHPLIQQQTYEHEWSAWNFQTNIAEARTFAFSREIEALWDRGLGKGGSLDNTIVFSDSEDGILNEEELRFPDECVRHKILDLIGDMSLLGTHVVGHIIANKSGHDLHTQLVQTIMDNPDAWILLGPEKDQTDVSDLIPVGKDSVCLTPLA